MSLNKDNKYPEIRFKGFTEDWEQRKLGEVTESYSGGTPSAGNKSYYGGHIPFIRSAEINNDNTELFLTDGGLNNSSAKMVEVGNILYALYGATSGEVGISQINGAINQAILAIKTIDGYNSQFIMQWFRLQKQKIIDKYLQGGQGNLSGSIVKELQIEFPIYDEQAKIGTFFEQLDNTIDLHQCKLDKMNNLKKAYLQALFPLKDSKIPSMRFANFTECWKQRKGSDIFKSVSDKNHPDLPVLSASQEKGMILRDNIGIDIKYDKKSLVSYKKVTPEQFVIHLRSFQGGFAYSLIEGITSPAYTVIDFQNKEQHSSLFWKFILSSPDFIKRLETVTYGIRDGRSISYSDFSTLKFNIPTINEQENIERFLNSLDKTIALHQQKLNKLKELKKAFLNKMFV